MEVTGLVRFRADGSADLQLQPAPPPKIIVKLHGDGHLEVGAAAGAKPPTPNEVRSKIQDEAWAVHHSKLPLQTSDIVIAVSNCQGAAKLPKGPRGGWSQAAWDKLKYWAESAKRARKKKGEPLLALADGPAQPAPALALLAPPSPAEALPPLPPPATPPGDKEDSDEESYESLKSSKSSKSRSSTSSKSKSTKSASSKSSKSSGGGDSGVDCGVDSGVDSEVDSGALGRMPAECLQNAGQNAGRMTPQMTLECQQE